jgi:hypothetical protein
MQLRLAGSVFASVAAALALPAIAMAHVRLGTVAVDDRAAVTSPAQAAFAARVSRSDLALRLSVRRGHRVNVLGAAGEPFLRIGPAGVFVDASSPTAASSGLAPGRSGWVRRSSGSSVSWRDARVRSLPAGARRGTWRVPLVVDGRRVALTGTIVRPAGPRLALWLIALALVVLGAAVLPVALPAVGLVAGASAAVAAAGFAVAGGASPGTRIASVDEIFLLVVSVALMRSRRLVGTVGLGVLALAVGLGAIPVFLHPIVLSPLPAGLVRGLTVVALGAGVSAAGRATVRLLAR